MKETNRVDAKEKCPACGWPMDANAYRCGKCRIYICFRCRRQIFKHEGEYRCSNRQCWYYGKLLCKDCTELVPEYETVTTRKIVVGCWEGIAAVAATLGMAVWGLSSSFLAGLITLGFALVVGCICASATGWAILSGTKNIPHQRQIGTQRLCIACRQLIQRSSIACRQPFGFADRFDNIPEGPVEDKTRRAGISRSAMATTLVAAILLGLLTGSGWVLAIVAATLYSIFVWLRIIKTGGRTPHLAHMARRWMRLQR
jgi:hypothetical protein